MRILGASGGFVTALLSFLFDSGEIDAAVVAGADGREPWRFVARVVTRPEELRECAGSRYTLVPSNAALSEVKGRCALVGLPCHVLGFRKLEHRDPTVSERIPLVIGIFCGVNLDPLATLHILKELGVEDRSEIAHYGSRSENYGGARVVLKDSRTLRYPDHDHYAFDVVRLAPAFQRNCCSLCFDNTNELADVSVGDAPGEERKQSFVVVRTPEVSKLVRRMVDAGRLFWSDADPDLHRANVFRKKRRAFTLMEWMRDRGMPTIEIDFAYDLTEYPWEREEYREEMLSLRRLASTGIGQSLFAGLPRNDLSFEVGLAYVGWKG